VVAGDIFDFLAHQRGDRRVVRLSDGESGLSARTIARRLSSGLGLLLLRGRPGRHSAPFEPSATGPFDSPAGRTDHARPAGPGAPDSAKDPLARRGRRLGGSAAHPPRPGHGLRHGAGWSPAL
jgi:hypothetical protein